MPIIRQWLLEKGLEFHKMARDFMSQFDQDMNPVPGDPGGGRVCLGSFSLSTLPETQLQAEPQEQVA